MLRVVKTTPSRVAFVEQLVSTSSFRSPAIAAMMAWLCSTVCTLILLTSSAFCLHPPDMSQNAVRCCAATLTSPVACCSLPLVHGPTLHRITCMPSECRCGGTSGSARHISHHWASLISCRSGSKRTKSCFARQSSGADILTSQTLSEAEGAAGTPTTSQSTACACRSSALLLTSGFAAGAEAC